MEKKQVVLKVASYLTPYPTVARVAKALMRSGKSVSEALPQGKSEGAQESEKTDWDRMTPSEKFQHAFIEGRWTEQSLVRQFAAFRAAKFVLLLVGLALIPAIIGVAISAPFWVVMLAAPAMASFSLVLLAQALRHAWWQCQIDLRSMITFKEFVGRSDLFARLFA